MTDKKYENRIIAYIDLLGFKEAVADEEKMESILDLLTQFIKQNGDHTPEWGYDTKTNEPIIQSISSSAFSDHIVISFLVIEDSYEDIRLLMVMQKLQNHIGDIAMTALSKGFLIRGAVTIGKLYHQNNMVFGKALVDAYNLESQTAIYPRILISKELKEYIDSNDWRKKSVTYLVTQDFDGYWILNYIQHFFFGPPTDFREKQVEEIIENNLKRVETGSKSIIKWFYFKYNFLLKKDLRK